MKLFIQKGGQSRGPFEQAEVVKLLNAGEFNLTDLAWDHKNNQWKTIEQMLPPAPPVDEEGSTPPPPANPPVPPPRTPSEVCIDQLPSSMSAEDPMALYVKRNDQSAQYSKSEAIDHLKHGALRPTDLFYNEERHRSGWFELSSLADFAEAAGIQQTESKKIGTDSYTAIFKAPLFGPVTSVRHALKVIRSTVGFYIFLIVVDLISLICGIDVLSGMLLIVVGTVWLAWTKSPAAATYLLVVSILGTVIFLLTLPSPLRFDLVVLLVVLLICIQFALTICSRQAALYIRNQRSINSQAKPGIIT